MAEQQTEFLWKVGAPAGQGVMTTGLLFSKLCAQSGGQVFDYAEYPSLIQGGHNTYEVLCSNTPAHNRQWQVDYLVCLDAITLKEHEHRLDASSIVVLDPATSSAPTNPAYTIVPLPVKELLAELKASSIMANMIALGASWALVGGDQKHLVELIAEQFGKKGEEVVNLNQNCAARGYEAVKSALPDHAVFAWKDTTETPLVMGGNDAFSLAAAAADCRFYAAYPMTPSSSVLATLAAWQKTTGMVVRHAEDEVGVISEALGASFAGVRACVGTSGGGFALMTESISYAGIAEIPIVIFLSQRPGPATGLPTATEQGDLLFATYAGHGEFPKIVLAPGDVTEMLELSRHAFDLADIYQTPVIVLSDKFLSESRMHLDQTVAEQVMATKPNYGRTIHNPSELPYLRYKVTEDGISERLIPGAAGTYYQANSYEHLEDSHTTEDPTERCRQVEKRLQKQQTYLDHHWLMPSIDGSLDGAKYVFVTWGSSKLVVQQARQLLDEPTAHIHFTHVYPMDREKVATLFAADRHYVLVENNATGQFGTLLRSEAGVDIKHTIHKYDGRAFYSEEIVAALEQHDR
ncbi:MAG: 2-oxoacid:acceptor oxidoreductase subunit alpha [bacterium]|nr:2-oxoacid:acceptor oxidoreductase subunit alpha [bacterium]